LLLFPTSFKEKFLSKSANIVATSSMRQYLSFAVSLVAARAMRLMARRCSTINSSIRYCALRPAPQLPEYRQAVGLSESCPKIGDVPKSPFPSVAALVPSAGTIKLQIELRFARVP
jgi:hypothetical protein